MDTRTIIGRKPIRTRRACVFTVDPSFSAQLTGYDLSRLGASRNTIYLLDDALCLRGFNAEYERFARRNGGRNLLRRYGLGAAVLEGFTSFYAAHYRRIYRRCLEGHRVYTNVYACSSPRAFRRIRETAEPLKGGAGLIVSHRLIESVARSGAKPFSPGVHLSPDGLILQCCHCQRIRNYGKPRQWDWLPEPPPLDISHGLCPQCMDTYYCELET